MPIPARTQHTTTIRRSQPPKASKESQDICLLPNGFGTAILHRDAEGFLLRIQRLPGSRG